MEVRQVQLQTEKKKRFKMPIYVVKKLDTSKKAYWITKIIGCLIAFLLAGVICTIFSPGTFGIFYREMFLGCFDFSDFETILELLETAGLLLLVAFALAPAFKMKFWNIGAEGQILIGCLMTATVTYFMPKGTSDWITIPVAFVCAVLASVIWAVIPAIFKAFFNTNETLFTLMMNYIAMAIISTCISAWVKSGSQVFPYLTNGGLPELFDMKYIINIIVVILVVSSLIVYLKRTKHGYELTVVGESVNTARYVGINVKLVIIRTLILSGAVSGIVGFLLVAGHHHTLSTTLADGRGFTGVLIAWLGQFEPLQMGIYAFLVAIFQRGSTHAASEIGMSKGEFSAIVTGMFFLVIIACQFFVNYKIQVNKDTKVGSFLYSMKCFFIDLWNKIANWFKKLFKKKKKNVEQAENIDSQPVETEIPNEEVKEVEPIKEESEEAK